MTIDEKLRQQIKTINEKFGEIQELVIPMVVQYELIAELSHNHGEGVTVEGAQEAGISMSTYAGYPVRVGNELQIIPANHGEPSI